LHPSRVKSGTTSFTNEGDSARAAGQLRRSAVRQRKRVTANLSRWAGKDGGRDAVEAGYVFRIVAPEDVSKKKHFRASGTRTPATGVERFGRCQGESVKLLRITLPLTG
jgi:hypothetical protein